MHSDRRGVGCPVARGRRMRPMIRRSLVVSAAITSAFALTLSACASPPGEPARDANEGLSVVASTTQIADFTRAVVGTEGTVSQLVQPNRSAHSFDPTASDLAALRKADVLVMNGLSLEPWLGDAVAASGFEGSTIVATRDIPESALHTPGDHADHADHDHADVAEDADHAEDAHEHAGEDHDHENTAGPSATAGEGSTETETATETEHEHVHEPTGVDPHVWTNPDYAARMVLTIAEGLAEAAPDHAAQFQSNATAYLDRIAAFTDWAEHNISTVPTEKRLLVSNHDAFGYFLERFGITFVGAIMPSFDDNAEPSAADMDALVAAIRDSGAEAVFSETSLSPKAAETIAREAGVAVFAGESALYGDSLGVPGTPGENYLGAQLHNVRVLLESWGVEPTPVPEQLRSGL